MKRYLFIFTIFFSLFKTGQAQTNVYHPFPDSNAVWTESYSYYYIGPPSTIVNCNKIEFLGRDTVISSFNYRKVYSSSYCYVLSDTALYTNNVYEGAIRQDSANKKIYYCNASTTTEKLLYDFNLSLGDTLPKSYINCCDSNYVSSIDSILIGTSYRKRYHINAGTDPNGFGFWDFDYVQLIEGIGSTFGLTYQIMPPFEGGSTLDCFSQNNVTLYPSTTTNCNLNIGIKVFNTQHSTFQIYPNPNNGSFIIEPSNIAKQTMQVYDVNGKVVSSQTINGKTNIDATSLNGGVYNISLISNEGVVNKRVVIVR